MLDPGKAYQEFYNGTDLTSASMYSMTAGYLSFNDNSSGFYGKDKDNLSVVLTSCIMFPETGPIQLRYTWDNGWNIKLDDQSYESKFNSNIVAYYEFSTTVIKNTWYRRKNLNQMLTTIYSFRK